MLLINFLFASRFKEIRLFGTCYAKLLVGKREQGTGNRGKREYFAMIFKNMAHFLYIASFMRFFCLDFAYYVLKSQKLYHSLIYIIAILFDV
jgi:hypothetical protein